MKNIEDLILPVVNSENIEGVDIKYDKIYTDLKNLRVDEDPNLSQGIWKRDLKKAEWGQVIELCEDIIINKTKDMQIVSWLCDAYIAKNGFKGLLNSILLIDRFLKAFINNMYPKDKDHIEIILEWTDKKICERIMQLEISKPRDEQEPYTLQQWIISQDLSSYISSKNLSSKEIEKIEKKGDIIEKKYIESVKNTKKEFYEETIIDVKKIESAIVNFEDSFNKLETGLIFPLYNVRSEISNLLNLLISFEAQSMILPASKEKKQSYETLKSVDVFQKISTGEPNVLPKIYESDLNGEKMNNLSRKELYNLINEISEKLSELEPHSPTPNLLKQISGWESKSLSEIISSVPKDEVSSFLKLLGIK